MIFLSKKYAQYFLKNSRKPFKIIEIEKQFPQNCFKFEKSLYKSFKNFDETAFAKSIIIFFSTYQLSRFLKFLLTSIFAWLYTEKNVSPLSKITHKIHNFLSAYNSSSMHKTFAYFGFTLKELFSSTAYILKRRHDAWTFYAFIIIRHYYYYIIHITFYMSTTESSTMQNDKYVYRYMYNAMLMIIIIKCIKVKFYSSSFKNT